MDGKRVLICGGRDYQDAEAVGAWLGAVQKRFGIALVIHGAAPWRRQPSGCLCGFAEPAGASLPGGLEESTVKLRDQSAINACWTRAGLTWCWHFLAASARRTWCSGRNGWC